MSKVLSLTDELGVYRQDWNRLNIDLYQGQPFFDSRFVEPALKYFATGKERLCVHSHKGKIDGLLILTPRRTGVWSLFAPSQAQIVPILLKDDTILPSLFTSLPNFSLSLEFLNQDPLLTPIQANSNQLTITREPHALTIAIKITDNFESIGHPDQKNCKKITVAIFGVCKKNRYLCAWNVAKESSQISEAVIRYGVRITGLERSSRNFNSRE
ncbi:hypothetical protein [Chromatium okenii]|uniref:hypothetical protein n=1 Tax=Chromatium okenii TaxID=61644 RepID=UPI00155895F1|nr:hypothetical protein [Chromatium okenii]